MHGFCVSFFFFKQLCNVSILCIFLLSCIRFAADYACDTLNLLRRYVIHSDSFGAVQGPTLDGIHIALWTSTASGNIRFSLFTYVSMEWFEKILSASHYYILSIWNECASEPLFTFFEIKNYMLISKLSRHDTVAIWPQRNKTKYTLNRTFSYSSSGGELRWRWRLQ